MPGAGWAAILVAIVGVVLLLRIQRRHLTMVRSDRAALFADAAAVLDEAHVEPRGLDFPVLHGRFQGRAVRVEAIVDSMGMRTVPVLRLAVAVREPLVGQPRLSVLADESGQEFYAGHRRLARLRNPAWPSRISVACEAAETAPEVAPELIDAAVAVVAEDTTAKQVLVTDRGVRCIVRATQSDPATYRVTRRVDLTGARVPADVLFRALRAAGSLCDRAGERSAPRPIESA